MLLKESLGSAQVKASLLFASLSDRVSESENILQMMSKIQRAAKPRKTHRVSLIMIINLVRRKMHFFHVLLEEQMQSKD